MSRTIVLGINSAHDAAACLLINGEIAVAVPEERLARTKHYEGYPHRAVDYCLRSAGLAGLTAVDTVVINEYVKDDTGLLVRQAGFNGDLIVNPSHHMLHAYYAWLASDLDRPAVLILDGAGYNYGEYERRQSPLLGAPPPFSEMEESESMYVVGDDDELRLVRKRWGLWSSSDPFLRFPSLGHMYSVASEYIFGHMMHAGKTMGLAPYGDASRFPDPIIEYTPDGLLIDTDWITKVPPRSSEPAHLDAICRDMAAKVQVELERAVLHLCQELHDLTGADELGLSGGVGLNSVTNGMILQQTPFRRLFVTPASGDSGVAIGAAFYGHQQTTGQRARVKSYDNYHGHSYSTEELQRAVDSRCAFVDAQLVVDVAEEAARDIIDGKFIGWFEGGSEFGPRALGHRSILCDPRPPEMRDRLNALVKFREPFRPYAASVLTEHVEDYFEAPDDDPFMMTVVQVRQSQASTIASVCHVDGTCRIQTVDRDHVGDYRRLIERFFALTGMPLVLNTSFNIRGEPVIETPDDAIECFLSCNLDVLYLGGFRITKSIVGTADSPERLVPSLGRGLSIWAVTDTEAGAAASPRYYCQKRTGHKTPISADEYAVLSEMDAQRSISDLAAARPGRTTEDVLRVVADLQQRGLVYLARPAQNG
ncbi:MAG TPA: carbamoyltransferase C-terminal domain-containing protein [Jatrophihabitans sp.]|uniref:carbamoyltransferase family protein n=1 Tax=Jatrophihabitans sp. TaxID=1932789 RepID=UPI002F1BDD00